MNNFASEAPDEDMLALSDALMQLEAVDPRKGRIVMLKFFAGFTTEEISSELGISKATIEREWHSIRSWLHKELDKDG